MKAQILPNASIKKTQSHRQSLEIRKSSERMHFSYHKRENFHLLREGKTLMTSLADERTFLFLKLSRHETR